MQLWYWGLVARHGAVIVALLEAGAPEIILTNRTRDRADELQSVFGNRVDVRDWADTDAAIGHAGLVVNTTSLGMTGQPPLPMTFENLTSDTVVTDLVYAPLETALLKTAKAKGCTTVDGLGMLLYQGVPGFERWFGTRPEVTMATRQAVLA